MMRAYVWFALLLLSAGSLGVVIGVDGSRTAGMFFLIATVTSMVGLCREALR